MAQVKEKKAQVMLGADPELFVRVTTTKKIVPVCGLIGGSKEEPRPFQDIRTSKGFAYQEDGCAFEFNVPAAHSFDHMNAYMTTAGAMIKDLLASKGMAPQIVPTQSFEESMLVDPRSRTIGCSPDFDAYGRTDGATVRQVHDITAFGNMRFAGGHLHLGYDKDKVPAFAMARFLDVLIGLPSLRHDKQGVRRQYYGKAGLFRPKPYGLEYRTLSNFWIRPYFQATRQHFPYHMFAAVWDLGQLANSDPERLATAFKLVPWQSVQDAINQENTDLAKEVWDYVYKTVKLPGRFSANLWKESGDL